MQYTDTQLKQALAKMWPEQLFWADKYQGLVWDSNEKPLDRKVLDTELLHLCWLVEETLTDNQCGSYIMCFTTIGDMNAGLSNRQWCAAMHMLKATWQQRTIALAKVKGIEI